MIAAVRISQSIGVSAVLVGALVVGFGTSVPELLVSALAAGNDRVDVALANVVGSNIANLSLVLGTAAIIIAIVADRVTLRQMAVATARQPNINAMLLE